MATILHDAAHLCLAKNKTLNYVLGILCFLAYLGLFKYFVLYWLVPYFTCFMIIGWFIEIAEHYPLVGMHGDSLYTTRNRFSHWIEAFFLSIHAENYHLVHHLWPTIPYWNVSQAHRIMMEDTMYRERNAMMGGVFQTFLAVILSHFA